MQLKLLRDQQTIKRQQPTSDRKSGRATSARASLAHGRHSMVAHVERNPRLSRKSITSSSRLPKEDAIGANGIVTDESERLTEERHSAAGHLAYFLAASWPLILRSMLKDV